MRHFLPGLVPLAAVLVASAGCSKALGEPPTYAFAFRIRIGSDDGTPIKGAEVGALGAPTVATDLRGEASLRVIGREGERRSFLVRCPKDFQSPPQPLLISLHQNGGNGRPFVYAATCVPLRRTVVVAVRMDGGPELPVYFLDEEVARTDASGAAHFAVKVASGEPFRVSIGTVDEDLRPQNPSAELSVGLSDDIVLFDQKITRVQKRVVVKRGTPRKPTRL